MGINLEDVVSLLLLFSLLKEKILYGIEQGRDLKRY